MDPDPGRPTVAAQENDPESLLNFVRALLKLRRGQPALSNLGGFDLLHGKTGSSALPYLRQSGKQRVLVALNPAAKPATVPAKAVKTLGTNLFGRPLKLKKTAAGWRVTLPLRSFAVHAVA